MKKNIFITAILLCSLFFSGCYDTVFYDVRNDVAPEKATVSGNITSITRYTVGGSEYLVLIANDGIKYKDASVSEHGAWVTLSEAALPAKLHSYEYFSETHEGEQMLKVLADESTLYVVSAAYENDYSIGTTVPSAIKLYAIQVTDWASITSDSWTTIIGSDDSDTYFPLYVYDDYYFSAFSVFQTNSPMPAHRKVYLRTGDVDAHDKDYKTVAYYELSGLSAPTSISVTTQDVTLGLSDNNCASSAVYFNDEVLFFNSIASTTNETFDDEATYFYFSVNDKINHSTIYHSASAGSYESTSLDAGYTVSALATCSDVLLVGRGNFSSSSTSSSSGGIKKTSLTDGVPGTAFIDFETNASFQISSSYYVTALINATPDLSELESDLYAAITYIGSGTSTSVSSSNKGLWSYYPDRGNWNRE
ncbi:MAG: hypothetical protein K5681_05605 [Treponema sp.]|nr:hypothetical protein [Treponema sp.]